MVLLVSLLLPMGRSLRQVVPQFVEGAVGPSAAFLAGHAFWGMFGALGLAFAWTGTCLGLRLLIGRRRVSALLVIAAVSLVLRTVVAVLMHSTTAFLLGPDIVTGGMGLVFLVSAFVGRPLVARIAGDFVPESWVDLENPRAQRICRAASVLWGVEQLATATVNGFLVFSVSPTTFVTLHEAISLALFVSVMGAAIPFFWGDLKLLRRASAVRGLAT